MDARAALWAGVFSLLSARAFAQAQEPNALGRIPDDVPLSYPIEEAPDASRTLNRHAFVPLIGVPWPFVATWVGSRTGMGIYDLPVVPVLNHTVTTKDAKLASFSQSFDGNFAVARWLALSVAFSAAHVAGINASGAFNVGLNYAYGGTGGAIARLLHRSHWYMSLRTDASVLHVAGLVPVRFASSLQTGLMQNELTIPRVASAGRLLRGTASLVLAESHTPYLGLQASTGFELNRIDFEQTAERNGVFRAGAGGSLRFNELGVPVALTAGGSLRVRVDHFNEDVLVSLEPRGRVTGQLETGILYSDPRFIDVGAQVSVELGESDRRGQARLVINHFW